MLGQRRKPDPLLKKGEVRQIRKNVDYDRKTRTRPKPQIFIITSSLMQLFKVAKDLRWNGYCVLGLNVCDNVYESASKISENFIEIIKSDVVVFFNSNEMMLWQGVMLGAGMLSGRKIYCVNPLGTEIEPVLLMPQVEVFTTWEDLLIERFPLRKRFIVKKLKVILNRIKKLKSKSSTYHRTRQTKRLEEKLLKLQREYDERFGDLIDKEDL